MTSHLSSCPAPDHHESVLATRGYAGYRQYRIPALAVSDKGTILAAYDGRPNLDDLPSPIDLLLRRSVDNGRTWEAQTVVRTGAGLEGFGDPSLLVDAETGRIFLFHAAGTRAGFFEATTGTGHEDDHVQHCDLSISDDDGLTWQHRRITAELKGSVRNEHGVTGIFASAGQGIQIHAGPFRGRLVQQFVLLCSGEIMAASALSDDHGMSWRLGQFISATTHGAAPNENKVVSLDDGRLLLHSRATPRRLASLSEDGGETWSPLTPIEELPDPGDNGSLGRFDGSPAVTHLTEDRTDRWLIATNNLDPGIRRNTALSLSPDDGRTWPARVIICPGSSGYSTAARLPDGNIGVLYERQGYREIVFTSIDPSHLERQLAATTPEARNKDVGAGGEGGGLHFDLELRSITPGLPAVWKDAGESHVVTTEPGRWDPSAWKEIGQGYAQGQGQVLGTREAQDMNYGPVTPAYKAGDILAFTGRARNDGPCRLTDVRLQTPRGAFTTPADLMPGQEKLYRDLAYTVSEADLNGESFELRFGVTADLDGQAIQICRLFTFTRDTGRVRVSPSPDRALSPRSRRSSAPDAGASPERPARGPQGRF